MAAETQYTTNTGMATINAANSSLTGGTINTDIWDVITGASNGTLIKTVTIKAQTSTSQGMIRLFLFDVTNTKLLTEVEVTAVTKSAINPSFEAKVSLFFTLESGWKLRASTQVGDTFNVIAEGQDWAYYTTSVRSETTKYQASGAATTVSTANPNLTGAGSLGTALITGQNGCELLSVTIKAKVSTTAGMIRLFLYDGTNTKLFMEIPVDDVKRSTIIPTFYRKIFFPNGFAIKSGWHLKASTEIGEAINIIPEAVNLSYPA